MIKQINANGFKSFKDLEISFKPLTVLCGTNGSGKSSVLQLLLMLKAYTLEAESNGLVKLKNDEFDLGRQKDVVYRWSSNSTIQIKLITDMGTYELSSGEDEASSENDFVAFQSVGNAVMNKSLVVFFEKRVRYLSSDRLPPQSMHKYSAYSVKMNNIGRHGENAVSLLYAHGQDEIPMELCHDGTTDNRTLKGQVNAWLADVSSGVSVRTTPAGELLRLDVDYGAVKPAQGFRPENVGFGISYVLPVLVMILTAKKGDCLLIENPGAQLHPQGQAQMGRLLAKAAAYGIQIIAETHSDHVVNGIRVGCKKRADAHHDEFITEDEVLYYDGVLINFFDRINVSGDLLAEQYTEVTPIRIEASGELECYPNNFLDEWPRQIGELA